MAAARETQAVARLIDRGRARRTLRSEPALVRLARQRAGLTQSELADVLGVDRSAVSRYEHGRRVPTGAQLDRLNALLLQLDGGSGAGR